MKHVKSNAITVAKGGKLLGMGSGQPNRVKSVQIALEKAAEEVKVGGWQWVVGRCGMLLAGLMGSGTLLLHVDCLLSCIPQPAPPACCPSS